ncbi:DpnII family type II restriction endonuclease [Thermococcus sp. 2319x1]|uniref:DpnII family type II restriction endonuclease n=1 Tax=Thermococcus sp. 2319x1 TaxID=1674923 RepID=UPI0015841366|nr:DpnII family type II restriction endonuclease [Thermococcus sp. 2319x1]
MVVEIFGGNIMVKYSELKYTTFEEYFNDFINTLLPTNKTYEYFVDWNRVNKVVHKYKREIKLLESLYGLNKDEAKRKLEEILLEYPSVLPLLPALIAERTKKGQVEIYDPDKFNFLTLDFNPHLLTTQELQEILKFCERTGILNVLTTVENLENYLFGVEVGLDTNARKGRSGKIFQKMVERFLGRNVPEYITLVTEDKNFSLYKAIGRSKTPKKHDFVFYRDGTPIAVMEVNFYNTTGSKPLEIVRSYITLNRVAKDRNITFIWVTDGPAWNEMKDTLKIGMKEIDWVINYNQLQRLINIFNSVNWELTEL